MVDIPGSAATSTTVTVGGGSIINTLETVGDRDWFRVNLVAGQAITVTLLGVTLEDPYLRIRDSSGAVIYENDDIHLGVELDSQISFAAPSNGVYFIDVGSWNDQGTGDYQLNVTAYQTPPVYTNDQIAEQLVSGYWGDGEHPWNVAPGGSITVNLTALTAEGQALARAALQNWSQIIGINFSETGGAAQITFDDNEAGAWTESQQNGQGFTTSAHINIDTAWLDDYTPDIGGYAYQAYLHEIGHALGLGHAGNYNTTANYPYNALFSNDAWSTSIMSYFSQSESTYFSNQNFTRLFVVTPMVADILAMQQLYGLSTTTRSGDTTYGFNSNAGTVYNAEAYSNRNVAMTIFDTGGNDTLDFSGYFLNQTINLNPETFSNIAGRVGNLSIARGSIIENAIGGFERDIIIGNSVANTLTGRDGNDTLTGGLGNDTFRDSAAGLSGDTITDFGAGDKIVITDAILAGFTFNLSGNTLTYTGGSLTLSGGVIGTVTASAAAGGGVQLSILGAIANDARNDFNGDGRSDVLWRNSLSGDVTNWLSQPNGGFVGNTQYAYNNSSSEWHIVGTGDFNGDGRDDILWRNDNGRVTNWLGNANGGFAGNIANAESHADNTWEVVGTGDFNGDGRDDVLWRNSVTGDITNWLCQPNGGFVGNTQYAYNNASQVWHIVGTGDFNGDGRDDILWRNDNGRVTNWLGNANGGFAGNIANAESHADNTWEVVGTGDFNSDGRDDVLWRNTVTGDVTNWLCQPNGSFVGNTQFAYNNASLAWHVVGTGDYNGDGRDDILWRNDNGRVTNWLGNANGGFAGNIANAESHADNSWLVYPQDYMLV